MDRRRADDYLVNHARTRLSHACARFCVDATDGREILAWRTSWTWLPEVRAETAR